MNTATIRQSLVLDCRADVRTNDIQRFSPFDLTQIRQTMATWLRRARTRRQLAAMDNWMLQDIGISRSAALYEASKPFWRA